MSAGEKINPPSPITNLLLIDPADLGVLIARIDERCFALQSQLPGYRTAILNDTPDAYPERIKALRSLSTQMAAAISIQLGHRPYTPE